MTFSFADLQVLISLKDIELIELRALAHSARLHEQAGVIDELVATISKYDITAADLGLPLNRDKGALSTTAKNGATVAKYRNAEGKGWGGGRGRRPFWVVQALAEGHSMNEFRVT